MQSTAVEEFSCQRLTLQASVTRVPWRCVRRREHRIIRAGICFLRIERVARDVAPCTGKHAASEALVPGLNPWSARPKNAGCGSALVLGQEANALERSAEDM